MFRPTSSQHSLFESRLLVPAAKRARLESSWAHVFLTKVLPLIDEEIYRDAFDPEIGRPNQSIRLLTAVHILKEWYDLTDEETLEQLEYSLQWQYALGITPDEAHLPRKTLHNHRVRTLENDRAREMFERVTRGLAEVDGLSTSRQRLDSTHVISNIAVLTRLGLLVETLVSFFKELKREAPEKLDGLADTLRKRYLEREGYFADAKKEQARRRLPVVAGDLREVILAFADDEEVRALASYLLVVRVFEEQCEVVDDDEDDGGSPDSPEPPTIAKSKLKKGKEISGRSLQSPHDPDATYGHKGKGYEVQVAETCVEENAYQVITHVDVNGAHESDQPATVRVIDALLGKGMAPDELLADTGYGSGENIVDAAVNGVDLQAPVQDPNAPPRRDTFIDPVADTERPQQEDDQPLGLGAFRFNATYNEVLVCPGEQVPISHEVDDERREPYKATFDGRACAGCALLGRCPTVQPKGNPDRILRWRDSKAATATRQRQQREAAFRENYKARSGIESTNEELKGRHGARDLRVRGRARVKMAMLSKATAVNVKRACQAALRAMMPPLPLPAPA